MSGLAPVYPWLKSLHIIAVIPWMAGHPALAMMAGLSSGGLPLSVHFVGRYFDEATLFQVGRAWERAAGTDEKHPPID